jgi:hypothetical protein
MSAAKQAPDDSRGRAACRGRVSKQYRLFKGPRGGDHCDTLRSTPRNPERSGDLEIDNELEFRAARPAPNIVASLCFTQARPGGRIVKRPARRICWSAVLRDRLQSSLSSLKASTRSPFGILAMLSIETLRSRKNKPAAAKNKTASRVTAGAAGFLHFTQALVPFGPADGSAGNSSN